MASRSGSGPTSGWYSARGVKSRCAPSRAPASSTWLTSSSSSEIAAAGSSSRAIARSASRKLSTWSAICCGEVLGLRVAARSPPDRCLVGHSADPPPRERPPEGDLVGVLEVATDRQPAGQSGDAQARSAQHPGEVRRRRLALEVGVGGQDHLGDRRRRRAGSAARGCAAGRGRCRRSARSRRRARGSGRGTPGCARSRRRPWTPRPRRARSGRGAGRGRSGTAPPRRR